MTAPEDQSPGPAGIQHRRLGSAGLKVSHLSLGGWATFGASVTSNRAVARICHEAFDLGVNFFDIADVYARGEAELLMGKALASLPRRHVVISTKCFWPFSPAPNDSGLSRKHVFESVHDSLKRIGTDYLDLFFCHRFDPETPVEETVRALDDLVHQGKILYWGTSEWTADQLRTAHEIADRRHLYAPVVEQPQYNLLTRYTFETELLPAVEELGMGTVVWSPLASGALTGKYDDGIPEGSRMSRIGWLAEKTLVEENLTRIRQMKEIADELGCTRSQLALAWTASRPGVSSVITGATSPEQLRENLGAAAFRLGDEARARLEALFPPTPAVQ